MLVITSACLRVDSSAQNKFKYAAIPDSLKKQFAFNETKHTDRLWKEKKIYDLTKSLPSGYVTDASVDYTSYIQEGINNYDNVIFPDFPVLINEKGISLRSNTIIKFSKNSKIILKPNALESYAILRIYNVSNVKLYSPVIVGDRLNHLGSKGEGGMGIRISGAENIEIYNSQISQCWGDGIYISNNRNGISKEIKIFNAWLDYNRRNGLTITSGKNITVENLISSNTLGTAPMSGLDIEPNNSKEAIDSIAISNYCGFNNGTSTLQVGLSNLPDSLVKSVNISINNVTSINAPYGLILGGFYDRGTAKVTGKIQIDDIHVINAALLPIKIGRNYQYGPSVMLKNVVFIQQDSSGQKVLLDEAYRKFKSRISSRVNTFIE